MSITPDSPGIVDSASNLLNTAWSKLQGMFGHFSHRDFTPEQSLSLVPGIDPRFIPRVPMTNTNLDVGLLSKLSNEGYKRGKEITEQTHPEFYREWVTMCHRAGLNRVPQLILADSKSRNAASLSGENAVMVSSSLLKKLNLREVRAVLGHELGHESSDHTGPRVTALGLLGGAGLLLGNLFARRGGFGAMIKEVENPSALRRFGHWLFGNGTEQSSVLAAEAYMVAGAFAGSIAANQVSVRPTELDADRKGAMISGDPEGLISALQKLEDGQKKHGFKYHFRKIKSGYPSTETRIERLREMAAHMPPAPAIGALESAPVMPIATTGPSAKISQISQAARVEQADPAIVTAI